MRIDKFFLERYGHFQDLSLEFADKRESTPDIHLIYGPNEAGKSTILHALVDMLFGYHPKRDHPYAFRFPRKNLSLAIDITQDKQQARLNRTGNRFTDDNNRVVPENAINTHGLTRDQFVARFSFNEKTLQEGGEAILRNEGELGNALFSASSGVTDFGRQIDTVLEPANAFYEPNKNANKVLTTLSEKLKAVNAELLGIEQNADNWGKLNRRAKKNLATYEKFLAESQQRKQELQQAQKTVHAFDTANRLRIKEQALEEYESLPDVPVDWLVQARELSDFVNTNSALVEKHETDVKRFTDELALLNPDTTLLAQADRIQAVVSGQSAQSQLEDSRTAAQHELKQTDEQIGICLAQLSLPADANADEYVLPAALHSEISRLADTWQQLQQSLDTADTELKTQLAARKKIEQEQLPAPAESTALETLVDSVRNDAIHNQLTDARDRRDELSSQLNLRLNKLLPWSGDVHSLRTLDVPGKATLKALQSELQHATTGLDVAKHQLDETVGQLHSVAAQIDAIASDDTSGGHQFNVALIQRDKAWQRHIAGIETQQTHDVLRATANDMADAMLLADKAQMQHMDSARQQAQLHQLRQRHAQLQQLKEEQQRELQLKQEKSADRQEDLQRVATALKLHEHATVDDVLEWLHARAETLDMADSLEQLDQQVLKLDSRVNDQLQRLRTVLLATVPSLTQGTLDEAGTEELLSLARHHMKKLASEQTEYNQHQLDSRRLVVEVDLRTNAHDDAGKALKEWQAQWSGLLDNSHLQDSTPQVLKAKLPDYSELAHLCRQRRNLDTALKDMQRQQQGHAHNANSLLDDLGRRAESAVEEAISLLSADLKTAEIAMEKAGAIEKNRHMSLQELDRLKAEITPTRALLDNMLAHCKAEDSNALLLLLDQISSRYALMREIEELTGQLKKDLDAETTEEALQMIDTRDEPSIHKSISDLNAQQHNDEQQLQHLYHEFRVVQDEIDNFREDQDYARLTQEKATLELDIADGAKHALTLRLGARVLESAIRRYRDENKGPMMQRAKDVFTTITCNNFTDLRTQPNDDGSESLLSIQSNGRLLLSSQMSKGTSTQLYLALRVAAYHEYCDRFDSLPFVADDIMETFDDQRSGATFEVLADMARRGQVIYLTHHEHMIDIAKDRIGDALRVHHLPARDATPA